MENIVSFLHWSLPLSRPLRFYLLFNVPRSQAGDTHPAEQPNTGARTLWRRLAPTSPPLPHPPELPGSPTRLTLLPQPGVGKSFSLDYNLQVGALSRDRRARGLSLLLPTTPAHTQCLPCS